MVSDDYTRWKHKYPKESIVSRYQVCVTLNLYLFSWLISESNIIEYDLRSGLSSNSKQILSRYRPGISFDLFLLENRGNHCQLLYIDNNTQTFTIIDPQSTKITNKIIDEISQILDYKYQPTPFKYGPQKITNDVFCVLWSILIGFLINENRHYQEIFQRLSELSRDELEEMIYGFINCCYDYLQQSGLIDTANQILDLRYRAMTHQIKLSTEMIDEIQRKINQRLINGLDYDDIIQDAPIQENTLYRELDDFNLSPYAKRLLLDLSEVDNIDTILDELGDEYWDLPKIYDLIIDLDYKVSSVLPKFIKMTKSKYGPRPASSQETKFVTNL